VVGCRRRGARAIDTSNGNQRRREGQGKWRCHRRGAGALTLASVVTTPVAIPGILSGPSRLLETSWGRSFYADHEGDEWEESRGRRRRGQVN